MHSDNRTKNERFSCMSVILPLFDCLLSFVELISYKFTSNSECCLARKKLFSCLEVAEL